ncbi:MAG: DUF6377 domain-containing protein [Candidatus Cryptobacteroides sp.]
MRVHLLNIISLSMLVLSSCHQQEDTRLLSSLDAALEEKALYETYFNDRVQVLKEVLAEQTDAEQRYNINKRIADSYRVNSIDSVVTYLSENKKIAHDLGDFLKEAEADFALAKQYVKGGFFVESNDILSKYRDLVLPQDILHDYYDAEHTYWGETMAYTTDKSTFEEKEKKRDSYRKYLFSMCSEGSWEWCNLKREEATQSLNRDSLRFYSYELLRMTQENSREYAEACYFYAHSFDKDEPEFDLWLVRSAIADIMCATKDYASLNEIARRLFDKGDIDRAFRYVADHCMSDALYYNGKLRPWQISQFFPEIEHAYQSKHSSQTRFIIILLIVLSFLLALLLSMLGYVIRRQRILNSVQNELVAVNQRLTSLNSRLQEADKVKEEYITLFLGILSDNITESRQYKNHVLKSIRQGTTKALCDEIEMLPSLDNDILEFYKMFDQTFVNLYPDFVDKFNALLCEGSEIYPKGEDILTPELRIFALIKLGITDSSRIASLLHYSANTIYNYRAKTKNKARGSRDDFEESVRNIE